MKSPLKPSDTPKLSRSKISQYLLFALLLALPLERLPAIHPNFLGSFVSVRISQIIGLALISINLPMLWRRRKHLIRAPWRGLSIFLFIVILSAGTAISLKRGLLVATFIIFVALLAWTIAEVVDLKNLKRYRTFLLIGAGAAVLFGFYQYFGNLLGLSNRLTGLLPRYTKEVFGFPRIQSTGYEPLFFADYLMIPMFLAGVYAIWRKRAYFVLIALFVCTFSLTLSRGAYTGLGVSSVALVLLGFKERRVAGTLAFVAASVFGIALAFGLIALAPRIDRQAKPGSSSGHAVSAFTNQSTNTNGGNSVEDRTQTRLTAIEAFKKHPAIGIGPGNFGLFAYQTDPLYFHNTDSVTNNEPIELLAEEGGLGLVAFFLFVVDLLLWLRQKRAPLKTKANLWQKGLILALLAIAVQYQTFSTLYVTHIWVAIGLLVGISAASGEPGHENRH